MKNIDEIYARYVKEISDSLDENSDSTEEAEFFKEGLILSKEDFIDEINTDPEFAKKWKVK